MTIWVDAQLSPRTAGWISDQFSFESKALRDLGLRDAEDYGIFEAARKSGTVILTKDADFLHLLERYGSPPKVLWLTCGNTSEAALQQLLGKHLDSAIDLLESGESLVEIGVP
jgi:predicted nuclease of predicted toxin-antitoxin system